MSSLQTSKTSSDSRWKNSTPRLSGSLRNKLPTSSLSVESTELQSVSLYRPRRIASIDKGTSQSQCSPPLYWNWLRWLKSSDTLLRSPYNLPSCRPYRKLRRILAANPAHCRRSTCNSHCSACSAGLRKQEQMNVGSKFPGRDKQGLHICSATTPPDPKD